MRIIVLLMILVPMMVHAQKKLAPVDKTNLLGIELPAGSKKDTRSISIGAANVLLSSESKSTGWTAGNTEVYVVAGDTYTRGRLHETLTRSAYTVSRPFPDTNMSLASGNGKQYIIYFSAGKGTSDLYIAEGSIEGAWTEQGDLKINGKLGVNSGVQITGSQAAQPIVDYLNGNISN